MAHPPINTNPEVVNELLTRGVVDIIVREHLEERLRSGQSLRVKLGIDPTGPNLHIGHAVPLRKLRAFQDAGHTAVLIIGDWTARIGDPTGRNELRPQLTARQTKKNAAKYLKQIFLILDKRRTEVRWQSRWFNHFDLQHVFDFFSKFTVAQLLEREDFQKRMADGREIHFHEPMYSLLQGYDSFMVKADLELGDPAQLFNMLRGRDVQRLMGQAPQDVMTVEVLMGLDGARKMSKSYDNYVGLLDAPADMYGKVMSIPDSLIVPYLTLTTNIAPEEIETMTKQLAERQVNPRDIKMRLARELVTVYRSATKAAKAEEAFIKQFQKGEIPDEIESITLKAWPSRLRDLVLQTGLATSASEATRLIREGGVKVNGQVMKDEQAKIDPTPDGLLISRGKRFFKRVKA